MFLTNTRHAYNGIRRRDDELYWNTETFFRQWHPGATYSLHAHTPTLHLGKRSATEPPGAKTTQGLERKVVTWVRMGDGTWDSAFAAMNNQPLAFALPGTPFGREAYVGNHMLDATPGQAMGDAYDAIIFLAPLEELRMTATVDVIYTESFKAEVARRYSIHFTTEQLQRRLDHYGVETLGATADRIAEAGEERPLPTASRLGPIDEWKRAAR